MRRLNTENDLLTVGELKRVIELLPDDTPITYRRLNITLDLDKTTPIHKAEATTGRLYMVTEYIEQATLDNYKGE